MFPEAENLKYDHYRCITYARALQMDNDKLLTKCAQSALWGFAIIPGTPATDAVIP